MNNYYVYIILCENGSLYTGVAKDLKARFEEHKKGRGAYYTKVHKPVKFLSAWETESVGAALRVEHYIKKQNKNKKLSFVENKRLLRLSFNGEKKDKLKIKTVNYKKLNRINDGV